MQIFNYQFKPKLVPTIATLLLLPILLNLGLWQSRKANMKLEKQALYEKRAMDNPVSIGSDLVNMDSLRYARIIARGQYETEFEILLDNQVYLGQAGYDVITPLHISGSAVRILVNRGWVPAGDDRNVLPVIDTPKGEVEVAGIAHDPNVKFFELSKPADIKPGEWQKVWQNLDMKRYTNAANFTLQPAMILLDAASKCEQGICNSVVFDVHHPVHYLSGNKFQENQSLGTNNAKYQ
jgi:surfeit locus 1 family protein